ncbi:VanW family protein [Clostridium malenominatum]|uniref:VanW family protein n=1 Tax=Clostridium malenominatum TaxID=1539 RepID=A0ABP3U9G2_9CLOT
MRKKEYRITRTVKILIVEFLVCSAGLLFGFTWRAYGEVKKWDTLIYPGVKIAHLDLGGRTKEEVRSLIKSQYIDSYLNREIKIKVHDKFYLMDNSRLIIDYDIDNIIEEVFNLGKNVELYKKITMLKNDNKKEYSINFTYDVGYIKEFVAYIEKDANKESMNATVKKMQNGEIKVISDVKGLKIQGEKLEELIKDRISNKSSEEITIEAPKEEVEPPVTKDKLLLVNSVIATFKTNFGSSTVERTRNIELATGAINGKLLMPGEYFSFNDFVGERTKERGFMKAPVIVNDSFKTELGGGICQVSSTLYNAVLMSGIKPLERAHHTIPPTYVDLGLDATVDWNNIDFKFKNTLKYPIFIEAYIENKNISINVYSNSSLLNRKYTLVSDVYKTIQANTQTVDDVELPIGYTSVVQKGYNGYKVRVIRNTYEDGVLINSEIITDNSYLPITGIVKVGLKEK